VLSEYPAIAAKKVGTIKAHGETPERMSLKGAAWSGWTACVKMRLSAITHTAICARTNSAFNGGTSPRNSRGSADPRNAIAAAAGVGNSIAADSSSGKLRLNRIDTLVGTGRNSAMATARAHT
jgi:hypothetical protein